MRRRWRWWRRRQWWWQWQPVTCRLIPSPPARVESMKMKIFDPGSLKAFICSSRASPDVEPSIRQYSNSR